MPAKSEKSETHKPAAEPKAPATATPVIPTNSPAPDTKVETQPKEEAPPAAPNPHLPAPAPSPLPVIESSESKDLESGIDGCQIPSDDRFTDGIFVNVEDGLEYALCVHQADTYGNTHSCKNTKFTWQGTKEEFKAKFDRK